MAGFRYRLKAATVAAMVLLTAGCTQIPAEVVYGLPTVIIPNLPPT